MKQEVRVGHPPDNLGSASVISDTSGNLLESYDYAPYGELHATSGSDSNHYLFGGKERDAETGLDYFGARYYGNALGRWMSPDWAAKPTSVPYASFGDPQTLNLYAYVANRPIVHMDADGHVEEPKGVTKSIYQGNKPISNENPECQGGTCDPNAAAAARTQADLRNKAQQTTTTTQSPVSVTQVGDHQVLFQQTTSVTTTTRDANGNVTGQTTNTTLTSAMYSLASGTPMFQYGNQTVNPGLFAMPSSISQSQAESSLGGASHVYDAMANIIRNDGSIRFGAIMASGTLGAPEIAGAARAGNILKVLWEVTKEAVIHKVIEHGQLGKD